jgi:hypothetical protein
MAVALVGILRKDTLLVHVFLISETHSLQGSDASANSKRQPTTGSNGRDPETNLEILFVHFVLMRNVHLLQGKVQVCKLQVQVASSIFNFHHGYFRVSDHK